MQNADCQSHAIETGELRELSVSVETGGLTPAAPDSGCAVEGRRRESAMLSYGEGSLPVPPLSLNSYGRLKIESKSVI